MLQLFVNLHINELSELELEVFYFKSFFNINKLILVILLALFLRSLLHQFYPNETGQAKFPLGRPTSSEHINPLPFIGGINTGLAAGNMEG